METKTARKNLLEVFISLYDWHTKLFHNVIVAISDEDANNRLGTQANHIAWIAGSLVHERYELANAIGISLKQTSDQLFENHKGIQDNVTYPPLAEFKKDWETITPVLKDALVNLSEEQLNGPDTSYMAGEGLKLFDSLIYFIDRESYCIGQIALYRRLLGYEAMKYD